MEGLIGEYFIGNVAFDWEPVKVNEGGCDVLSGLGVGKHPGSWVLHVMESVQGFAGYPGQDCVTVVQVGGNEGMDEGLSHGVREWWPESGDIFKVEEARFCDWFNVLLEREGGV